MFWKKTVDPHSNFTQITEEEIERVKKWLNSQKGKLPRETDFLDKLKESLQKTNKSYWAADYEPSVKKRKIFYAVGENVATGYFPDEWNEMAKKFAKEYGSRLATRHEQLIWYALRIVKGYWTLDEVANDSSKIGNYRNAPYASKGIEKVGKREARGHCDGQGNTCKIVLTDGNFEIIGGFFGIEGSVYPVANIISRSSEEFLASYCTGSVVLEK